VAACHRQLLAPLCRVIACDAILSSILSLAVCGEYTHRERPRALLEMQHMKDRPRTQGRLTFVPFQLTVSTFEVLNEIRILSLERVGPGTKPRR
jgi:hypothetical protein